MGHDAHTGQDRPDRGTRRGGARDPGPVRRRATSFGARAADYDRYRPDYPDRAVRWALEPVRDRSGLRVLDLGAGTGKLTRSLVGLGADVVAVDPDPVMLARLREGLPGVNALAGAGEDIPLPDASVDAVLVGQAFHWFDPARTMPETARVLRPGGVLAALWNYEDDRVDWVAGLVAAGRAPALSDHGWQNALGLPGHPAFGPVEREVVGHVRTTTAAALTAMFGTFSHVLVLPPDERAELLRRVRGHLDALPLARGEFGLPMLTTVVRRRRGEA